MLLVLHLELQLFVEKGCFSWETALIGLHWFTVFNEVVFYLRYENYGACHAFIQIRVFLKFVLQSHD